MNELTAHSIASERSLCVHARAHVHTCILVHACMYESQRKTSGALLYILDLIPFKHGLLLNLEPTGPGDPTSIPTPSFGVIGIHGHSWLFFLLNVGAGSLIQLLMLTEKASYPLGHFSRPREISSKEGMDTSIPYPSPFHSSRHLEENVQVFSLAPTALGSS